MLRSNMHGPTRAARLSARRAIFAVLLLLFPVASNLPQARSDELPAEVRARLTLRTPVNDELLHGLEQDFVELLQKSKNSEALLKAEELLAATNDNTHWTNYSEASRILRESRDRAAIPLLLRYVVLHSQRSSCHIMIPEYCRSLALISGTEMPDMYEAGPNMEERMRVKVQAVVNTWWREAKATLSTDPEKMTADQLRVAATILLNQVRRDGDFTGSGGKRDSVYGAYHNVYYRLHSGDAAERHAISPRNPSMVPMFLVPSGYRPDKSQEAAAPAAVFPYETVIILGEFAKNGSRESIERIAHDASQNSTVRAVCLLALYRAGFPYDTERMSELLASETDLERRLIMLLSLRWGDERGIPVLLKHMDDPNIDVATAAACALVDAQPREAISKLKNLLDRNHADAPLMLLNAAAEFQAPEAKELLKNMLVEAVEGRKNGRHLSRILDAFTDAYEISRDVYRSPDDRDYHRQARLALEFCREREQREKAELQRVSAQVESLETQLKIAEQIETLRRNEYKRLLQLQGDEVVTADESKQAHDHLQAATAEVESLRRKLREMQSLLMSLNTKVR